MGSTTPTTAPTSAEAKAAGYQLHRDGTASVLIMSTAPGGFLTGPNWLRGKIFDRAGLRALGRDKATIVLRHVNTIDPAYNVSTALAEAQKRVEPIAKGKPKAGYWGARLPPYGDVPMVPMRWGQDQACGKEEPGSPITLIDGHLWVPAWTYRSAQAFRAYAVAWEAVTILRGAGMDVRLNFGAAIAQEAILHVSHGAQGLVLYILAYHDTRGITS